MNPCKKTFWKYIARPHSKDLSPKQRKKAWGNFTWASIISLGAIPAGCGIALGTKYLWKKGFKKNVEVVNPRDLTVETFFVPSSEYETQFDQLPFSCQSESLHSFIHFQQLEEHEKFDEKEALNHLKPNEIRFFILLYKNPPDKYIFRLAVDGKIYQGYSIPGALDNLVEFQNVHSEKESFTASVPELIPRAYKYHIDQPWRNMQLKGLVTKRT